MCIYQRRHTKASSSLAVGHEFHYVIRRTIQRFADFSHGFNRDVFISDHFGNDIVAAARSLLQGLSFSYPCRSAISRVFCNLYPYRQPRFKQDLLRKQEQSILAVENIIAHFLQKRNGL